MLSTSKYFGRLKVFVRVNVPSLRKQSEEYTNKAQY